MKTLVKLYFKNRRLVFYETFSDNAVFERKNEIFANRNDLDYDNFFVISYDRLVNSDFIKEIDILDFQEILYEENS